MELGNHLERTIVGYLYKRHNKSPLTRATNNNHLSPMREEDLKYMSTNSKVSETKQEELS